MEGKTMMIIKNWVLIIFQNLALNLIMNKRHMTFIMSVEEILDLVFEKNGAIKEKKMAG